MAQYRKKPVVIEAVQWFPGVEIAGVEVASPGDDQARITTLEGIMRVAPGDWVITGVAGEMYPCRDDIFRATYEPV